jgi:hypothetical protein
MNLENLLKFFVLSVRQYQMGAGYLKANFKCIKALKKISRHLHQNAKAFLKESLELLFIFFTFEK